MIPRFPEFKRLEYSDKPEYEFYTQLFPPYSDFNFTSLWCWNGEKARVSLDHGNLFLRMSDYETGRPIYSILGNLRMEESVNALFRFLEENQSEARLHLVPEACLKQLTDAEFEILENRDHFDYLYDPAKLSACQGRAYETFRNMKNRFMRHLPHGCALPLNLKNSLTHHEIRELQDRWGAHKDIPLPQEEEALSAFLALPNHGNFLNLGLYAEDRLVAFNFTELLPGGTALTHFCKSDNTLAGVNDFLMHALAKELTSLGVQTLNYEQDLGIPSLRHTKIAFRPKAFFKKYSITRKHRLLD